MLPHKCACPTTQIMKIKFNFTKHVPHVQLLTRYHTCPLVALLRSMAQNMPISRVYLIARVGAASRPDN
jgi:hypothetical protein